MLEPVVEKYFILQNYENIHTNNMPTLEQIDMAENHMGSSITGHKIVDTTTTTTIISGYQQCV